jgi:mRNA interferase RelE/StbE
MARMKYHITFAPEARNDFRSLPAFDRAKVRDAINGRFLHQPTRQSKSRIKRLRDMNKPQYRLRVGNIRVFYDVRSSEVEVLGVVDKAHAAEWLEKWGE